MPQPLAAWAPRPHRPQAAAVAGTRGYPVWEGEGLIARPSPPGIGREGEGGKRRAQLDPRAGQ